MAAVQEIECKSLMGKSNIPEVDYCVNPYVGCLHACVYCYARFMKRFTHHRERWGDFLDIKVNAPEVLEKELSRRTREGVVLLGSVTDPYQPAEKQYRITRRVLEVLVPHSLTVSILTKSDLILRDIDLIGRLQDCEVGLSITSADDAVGRAFEPGASPPAKRIETLKELHAKGITTYAFIGPILPGLTRLDEILDAVVGHVDFVVAEALNTRCGSWSEVCNTLQQYRPDLVAEWENKVRFREYWKGVEAELKELCGKIETPLGGFYLH